MKMVVLLLNGTICHKIVILTLLSTLTITNIHNLPFFFFSILFCILFVCIFLMFTKRVNVDGNLVKKAVKLALNDLKEKNAGVLLSAHAVKVHLTFFFFFFFKPEKMLLFCISRVKI